MITSIFKSLYFLKWCPIFDTSPLTQFSKFNNFLWVCWFLGKNISNFVYSAWKLNNPYCHNRYAGKRRTVGNRYAGTKRCVVKKHLMSKTGSNRINLKVGKSQKQFFLPSILPKNEQKKLPNSAIAFTAYWIWGSSIIYSFQPKLDMWLFVDFCVFPRIYLSWT